MSVPASALADDGGARHLQRGRRMPDIELPTASGRNVSFARLAGRAIVYCYPWTGRPGEPNPPGWDDIPGAHGSTPELEGFRDRAAEFAELGLRLFGLSSQTTEYQRELVARLGLPFPILGDADGRFAALRLPSFTAGGEIYLKRLTLLIDEGRIESVFYPVRDPAGHAAELLLGLKGAT